MPAHAAQQPAQAPVKPVELAPTAVTPTPEQVAYQRQELIGFIHFGVNTFTDREWGKGAEKPAIFNPSELDTHQWAELAKKAGMGTLIITAKHHDGFCLWPSSQTEHSVKRAPWKGGRGDVVAELSKACQKAGVKLGIYLSPWDMHEPSYGTKDYNRFYLAQLKELLVGYGPVAEVWMDGAKGKNAKDMEYDFAAYRALVRKLQPKAVMFSDQGPDVRWIGNEKGIAPTTCWSTMDRGKVTVGGRGQGAYLGRGDPEGKHWVVGECDVSIRPGWFYHKKEDTKVKSPAELVDLYYRSVGRNCTLLLNLPPDRRGLIHETDAANLLEMRSILDESFTTNLARGATASASNTRSGHARFGPEKIIDPDLDSYWATDDGTQEAALVVELPEVQTFDRLMLQEPIWLGQRVKHFRVEVEREGQWSHVVTGTTIGYKRLLRFPELRVRKLRVSLQTSRPALAISNFGLFKASAREPDPPTDAG
ncbi:MAG: alpha-L-fucosidase [Proteobacteria bacterium]|nr:alpha-L-fucosidase [Pseudomonadota bacterium]